MFILPQFESTIKELGVNVPTITLVIMDISRFVRDYFIFIFGGLAGFIGLLFLFFKKTKAGK